MYTICGLLVIDTSSLAVEINQTAPHNTQHAALAQSFIPVQNARHQELEEFRGPHLLQTDSSWLDIPVAQGEAYAH